MGPALHILCNRIHWSSSLIRLWLHFSYASSFARLNIHSSSFRSFCPIKMVYFTLNLPGGGRSPPAVWIQRKLFCHSREGLMFKTDPIASVFFHYDGKEAHLNIWFSGGRNWLISVGFSWVCRAETLNYHFYGLWRLTLCIAALYSNCRSLS